MGSATQALEHRHTTPVPTPTHRLRMSAGRSPPAQTHTAPMRSTPPQSIGQQPRMPPSTRQPARVEVPRRHPPPQMDCPAQIDEHKVKASHPPKRRRSRACSTRENSPCSLCSRPTNRPAAPLLEATPRVTWPPPTQLVSLSPNSRALPKEINSEPSLRRRAGRTAWSLARPLKWHPRIRPW